jgi:aldose 1-epimerase
VGVFTLDNERLGLEVSTDGAAIWRFFAKVGNEELPLMRPPRGPIARNAGRSACFPLVPFGNRVAGNQFAYDGAAYSLAPNADWDPLYLHGDGWRAEWRVAERSRSRAQLVMRHEAAGTPYSYEATQTFVLEDASLVLHLEVVSRSATALPFGLGWHPYFPLTAATTLRAPAVAFWREGAGHVPAERVAVPRDLDFTSARELPRHWINGGFEGWNGACEIEWPEHAVRLRLDADALFGYFFLFVSDPAFDASYNYEFFAFEPMSHMANAHNLAGGAGLCRLKAGESLSGSIRLTAEANSWVGKIRQLR